MKKFLICSTVILSLFLLPVLVNAGASISISQSGADSNTVMKDKVFTVSISGATANAQATISLPTGFSLTGEGSTKTTDNNGAVSWTTVMASQKLTAQTISVSISGQGSPETATSSSFSVVLPPSLTATVDKSSVSVQQGSTFSLSLNIQNSGETTARFGTITVSPSDFSISSGCSPSDISGGQSSGISCTIAASSSAATGAKTLTLTIAPSNADTITKTVSVTVTALGTTTTVPSGAGGGGAGAEVVTKKTQVFSEVTPEAPAVIKNIPSAIGLTQVSIEVKNTLENIEITVEHLTTKPATIAMDVTGMAYRYIDISKKVITDENISKVTIDFEVNKTWISDNNIDKNTVALYRYTTAWDKLPTVIVSEGTDFINYHAISPGLSTFVISGEAKAAPPAEVPTECPTCPAPAAWSECVAEKQTRTNYRCSSETNYECQSYIEEQRCELAPETVPEKKPLIPKAVRGIPLDRIIAIVVAIAVAVFTVWWYKLRRKMPWKTGLQKTFWPRKFLNPKTSEEKEKRT